MFVKEFRSDLTEAIGACETPTVLRRLTDAVRILMKSGLFDPLIGDISVCVCGNFITLPREVGAPLGITVDAFPAIIRNEWFTYHINGTGDVNWTPVYMADVLGTQFPTIRDPDRPVKLGAVIHSPVDANKKLRVFGWDASGNRIMSLNKDGKREDGFFVPTVYNKLLTNADAPPITKIDFIYKDETSDLVDLLAIDPDTNSTISTLGSYRPSETNPQYTRLRVAANNVVRVKFKRREIELVDEYDWIPVNNRLALMHAVRAVKFGLDGKYSLAESAEGTAIRWLKQEYNADRPGGIAPPQVINNEPPWMTAGSSLFYGRCRR